jgi:hypothetical protein
VLTTQSAKESKPDEQNIKHIFHSNSSKLWSK